VVWTRQPTVIFISEPVNNGQIITMVHSEVIRTVSLVMVCLKQLL
jgi:hypothetical protein